MTTKNTDMEHHTIELEDNTSLEIEYEVDAGVEGSYHEAPSNGFISIQSCKLCQHNGTGAPNSRMLSLFWKMASMSVAGKSKKCRNPNITYKALMN